jgi:uncharacterized Zn-finger protein
MVIFVINLEEYVLHLFQFSLSTKVSKDGKPPVKLNVVVDNSYMCQYCTLKFNNYFTLKSHMSIHKDEQVRNVHVIIFL